MGKTLTRAILDGAQQIAMPAFVASLSIGIVFVSVVFLDGPARFLFVPMGLAVGLSVMASYLLSRTLIPTLAKYLLRARSTRRVTSRTPPACSPASTSASRPGFERFRDGYLRVLERGAGPPAPGVRCCSGWRWPGALVLVPFVGRDFFPAVDAGQIRLHVNAPRRHPPGGDRAAVHPGGGRHPRADPRARPDQHPRSDRHAGRLQPGGHRLGQRQQQRRGDPGRRWPHQRTPIDPGLRAAAARASCPGASPRPASTSSRPTS